MNQKDKIEFGKCFAASCMVYDLSPNMEKANIYFSLLINYSIADIIKAFAAHPLETDRGRFFPKPADIVFQIDGSAKQIADKVDQSADLHWSKIVQFSANGVNPNLNQPEALSALKSIGGIAKVGYTNQSELQWLKRDFIAIYKAIISCKSSELDKSLPFYDEIITARQGLIKND